MKKLQELFAFPEGVKVETEVLGFPLYSSERIKERFVEAVLTSKYFSGLEEEIRKLVIEKQRVVPCWQSKNVISFLSMKIFQAILGAGPVISFFDSVTKKIYMILDNYTNWFLHYPNSVLTRIFRHELVHLCAESNPNLFLLVFKNYIVDFYVLFFKNIFKIPETSEITTTVWNVVRGMTKKLGVKTSSSIFSSEFPKIVSPLKEFTKDKKRFDKTVDDIVKIVKIVDAEGARGFEVAFSKYKYVFEALYKTYEYLSIPTYGNACFQELFAPQEVISLHVEKGILKDAFTRVLKAIV